MGFFPSTPAPSGGGRGSLAGVSVATLHRAGCNLCPLNNQAGLRHPHMEPTGSDRPLVYVLGEAPGKDEDREGRQFVGRSGEILRTHLPRKWLDKIRWNNVVRTRPPGNRDPSPVEVECCRPSVISDVERSRPTAILGFGAVPLHWATGQTTITNWSGRRVPVKIGNHVCWYYPILHPSFVGHTRKFEPRRPGEYGSDTEFAFYLDIKRALDEVEVGLPEPRVWTTAELLSDVQVIDGSRGARDVAAIQMLLDQAAADKFAGLDYETKKLHPYAEGAKLLTAAVSSKSATFAFPLDHPGGWRDPAHRKEVRRAFGKFLHRAPCVKIAHNLAFEMEWSAHEFGRECLRSGRWHDTQSQAYVLDERSGHGKCMSLRFVGVQYLGVDVKKPHDALDKDNLDRAPLADVLPYNGVDAKACRLVHYAQWERIKSEGLVEVYRRHMRRVPTMVLTQILGVPVDQEVVRKFHDQLAGDEVNPGEIKQVEREIAKLDVARDFRRRFGRDLNPASNPDLLLVFNKVLGRGLANVDETALEKVKHPLAPLVLKHRNRSKLYSTYVKPLMVGAPTLYPDGRIHPVINTTSVKTWRTSSEDPNSQNFPNRENKEVREQVGERGKKVVSFDYGQIQARNVAMESEDPVLVKSFWDRHDIHADWTEIAVRVYPRWISEGAKAVARDPQLFKKYRNRIKNELVFPSFFGARAKKISQAMGVPVEIAEQLHEMFWDKFGGIKKWHKRIAEDYRRLGYVTGHSGFRRRAPVSPNEMINAPIQADEALIVCDAMAALSEYEEWCYQASMEIHDDLTFVWDAGKVDEYAPKVITEMLKVRYDWINVPLVVEMSIGDNWANKVEVGAFASDTWTGEIKQVA